MNKPKVLIMDVDGTLTNGNIYISSDGEIFKSFNVKDGMGIAKLEYYEIIPIIVTGRKSEIVTVRAEELGIKYVYQGVHDKISKLKEISEVLGIELSQFAYIGDDINDLEAMKVCGMVGTPKDGVREVQNIAHFVSKFNGGQGAVREFIEYILLGGKKNG